MTTRIDTRFAELKREGRAAFVAYVMCGDPDIETSLAIIKALPSAGADVIEVGMPFTDPMADGPSIQAAGLRALKAGTTLKKTLDVIRRFRESDDRTPIVLMGYYNPIYIHGVDKFLNDAKAAGIDGLIIVDLPPEEDDELCIPTLKAGLNFIRLATPTTDDKRLPAVLANTSGFVYYVSVKGITGSASADAAEVSKAVGRIKRHTSLPVVVGFGIRHAGGCRHDGSPCGRRCGRHRAGRCRPQQPRCDQRCDTEDGCRARRCGGDAGRRRARRTAGRRIAFGKRKVCRSRDCRCRPARPYNGPSVAAGLIPGASHELDHKRRPAENSQQPKHRQRHPHERSVRSFPEPCMNWISNVVRPKIRSILNRRETPENLWIKCPDTGQLVFFKDVEANQFVIPGSNYHMQMSATRV